MGLESASFISQLDNSFPLGGDPINQGDDHLRLIKSVLQGQFPNFTAAAANMTITELNLLVGLLASTAELNILNGALLSTSELNTLNGILSTTAELNRLQSYIGTVSRALVSDGSGNIVVSGVTVTELNKLDGLLASTAELNLVDGLLASTAELNTMNGILSSTSELNRLQEFIGTINRVITSNASGNLVVSAVTTAELNILDGLVSTTAELNRLQSYVGTASRALVSNGSGNIVVSGVTVAELDRLDGILPTTAELNHVDGVTSPIQTQFSGKANSAHSHTGAEISALDTSDITTGSAFPLSFIPTIDQTKLGANSVGQSEVKTASHNLTFTSATYFTTTGGIYVIGWEGDKKSWSVLKLDAWTNSSSLLSEYLAGGAGPSGAGDWRLHYINSSPPYDLGDGEIPLFIYAVIDNATSEIVGLSISPDPVWAYNGPTNIVANAIDKDGKKVIRVRDTSGLPDIVEAKTTPRLQKSYIDALKDAPMIDLDPNDQAIKNADMNFIPHPFRGNNGGVDSLGNPMLDLAGKTVVMLDPVSPVLQDLFSLEHDEAGAAGRIINDGFINIGNDNLQRGGPSGLQVPSLSWK